MKAFLVILGLFFVVFGYIFDGMAGFVAGFIVAWFLSCGFAGIFFGRGLLGGIGGVFVAFVSFVMIMLVLFFVEYSMIGPANHSTTMTQHVYFADKVFVILGRWMGSGAPKPPVDYGLSVFMDYRGICILLCLVVASLSFLFAKQR